MREQRAARTAAKECRASATIRSSPKYTRADLRRFTEPTKASRTLWQVRVVQGKAHKEDMDAEDEETAENRKTPPRGAPRNGARWETEAFAAEYGSNHNRRNAFGKCVAKKAEESTTKERLPPREDVADGLPTNGEGLPQLGVFVVEDTARPTSRSGDKRDRLRSSEKANGP